MKEIKVEMRNFTLGVCEEYNVRRILFDVCGYRRDFGEGMPVLLVTRPGETQSYPLNLEVEGDYAVWVPQQRDTDIPGTATLVLQWYVDGGLAISTEYYGRILGSKSDSGEVPEAEERWYREVLQAGADAVSGAKTAEAAAEQAETAAGSAAASLTAAAENAKAAEAALEALKQGIASGAFKGDPGPMGATGPAGTDGRSAYEVAVANGFVGTEAEWLESLVGETGAPGATGPTGAPGPTGATGPAGADGKSAYQYAVAGGYTGTEAEFAAKMAESYISYALNTVDVVGVQKALAKLFPEAVFAPNGLVMGGTAQAAGLVTRGICGVMTPDANGACTKDNLYINYDGTNEFNTGRQLILQAGSAGENLGSNMHQYAVPRGDIVKAYCDANYIGLTGDQTISGVKTFAAPASVSGSDQATLKFKTSNGGAVIIGKEGSNSGTMIRFDQVDGTCRLRFRASATAGAMVWEQPEKGANLFIDLGSHDSDYRRIQFPSAAGTLALESQIPSDSHINSLIDTALGVIENGSY